MKHCSQCQGDFEITDSDRAFYEKVSPVIAGKKYLVPEPTHCPDCRLQRRLSWRNERTMYWRKCDATGRKILSVFSPSAPFKVYDNDYWWSDQWDAKSYGRDFDFNRTFFQQFSELMTVVPQLARSSTGNVNSDYTNQSGWLKNCYLCFEADSSEDCLYCGYLYHSKTSIDCLKTVQCQLCYDCVNIVNCYGLKGSQNAENCSDSSFLKNTIGCKNCFGCINLRNKEYYFFNEKLSKEEYEMKMNEIDLSDARQYQEWKQKSLDFFKRHPHKYYTGSNNEDSTGDYLRNTQRCRQCFDVLEAQDCAYVAHARNINNVQDMNVWGGHGGGASFCYEVHEVGVGVRNVLFSTQCWEGVQDVLYSMLCPNDSKSLFGCVGLRHAQYCILNKQYSKEAYEDMVPRIIEHMKKEGEWGEFFPTSISPFGYNETMAQFRFPLDRHEVTQRGWKWSDYQEPFSQLEKTIDANRLPERTVEIPDDILQWAIRCEITGKLFRLVPQELKFYREQKLPVPHRHPDQRHQERLALLNPWKLYDRHCHECNVNIQTTYAPDRPEKIYCEPCYQQSLA